VRKGLDFAPLLPKGARRLPDWRARRNQSLVWMKKTDGGYGGLAAVRR